MWTLSLYDASLLTAFILGLIHHAEETKKTPHVTDIWLVKKEKLDLQFSIVTFNCSYNKKQNNTTAYLWVKN